VEDQKKPARHIKLLLAEKNIVSLLRILEGLLALTIRRKISTSLVIILLLAEKIT